ncbi:MAG: DUF3987 domain-containing protein [Cycloclasticus sp.]|jgi:hypothetical protein|nr:DUF3987 domain-containing protein [Cycloclasticus sp.]
MLKNTPDVSVPLEEHVEVIRTFEENKFIPPSESAFWLGSTPVAYPSKDIGAKYEFPSEPFDDLIPRGGFVEDFVLGSRNIASPTLFGIWTGLYTVSSILKRNAYYAWADTILVPNLFMLVVAPPGIVKKSTQLNKGLRLFKDIEKFVTDPYMLALRLPKTRKGAITPEALHSELVPEHRIVKRANGTAHRINTGSTLNLVISELTTLLDKKKYNVGLIDKLTSLFDSSDIGEDKTTKTEGVVELRDIYVTLAGATTPEAMKASFPEEALGGGFLSRAVIVYASAPTRIYSVPPKYELIPDNDELARRLAWIIDNARGEYKLTREAFEAHDSWYRTWAREFTDMTEREQNLYARYDILVLKIALILRAQRYELGNDVTIGDYRMAHKLLDATMGKSKGLLGFIHGSVDTENEDEIVRRIQSKNNRDHAGLMRKNLQGNVRTIYKGREFAFAIRDLFARREIFSYDNGEVRFDRPKEKADETYFVFPRTLSDLSNVNELNRGLLAYVAQITNDQDLRHYLSVDFDEAEDEEELELEPMIY